MRFIVIGAFVLSACVQTPIYDDAYASNSSEIDRCKRISLEKFPPDVFLMPSHQVSISSQGLVLENSSTARREIFKRQTQIIAAEIYPRKGEMASDDFFIKYGSRPVEVDFNEEQRERAYLVCRGLG